MSKVSEDTNQAKLWQIIDDVDTLSDVFKPTELIQYKNYFRAVNKRLAKRHEILESDGYDLFEMGTMPKSNDKPVVPSAEQPVNTDNSIPISYVKKFTPLVVGDGWENSITDSVGFISEDDVSWFNRFNSEGLCIKSFVDRPNTGTQPVGDDVVVNIIHSNYSPGLYKDKSSNWIWGINPRGPSIKSWKPNHAAMLKQYQSEQEPPKLIAGKWAVEGESLFTDTSGGELTYSGIDGLKDGYTLEVKPPLVNWGGEQRFDFGMVYLDCCDNECEFIGLNSGNVIGKPTAKDGIAMHNKHFISISDKDKCKPIDTRTDKEKLRDTLSYMINVYTDEQSDEIAGGLLSSDKFTITLNEG